MELQWILVLSLVMEILTTIEKNTVIQIVYDYDDYDDDGDDGDDGDDEQGKLRGRQSIMAWYEWSRGSLRPVAIFFQIGIVMMTKLVIIVMMILVNDEWCGGCWFYSSLKAFNCYWN